MDKDKALLKEILRLTANERRADYRTVWRHLRRNDLDFNHKQLRRIWKREGLRLPLKSHKRRRRLVVHDEYTRECLGLEVENAMRARKVVGVVKKLVLERVAPEFIHSNNGPEFVAREVREWI